MDLPEIEGRQPEGSTPGPGIFDEPSFCCRGVQADGLELLPGDCAEADTQDITVCRHFLPWQETWPIRRLVHRGKGCLAILLVRAEIDPTPSNKRVLSIQRAKFLPETLRMKEKVLRTYLSE